MAARLLFLINCLFLLLYLPGQNRALFLNLCLTSAEYYDTFHEIGSRAGRPDRKSWFVMNIMIIIVIGDKMKLP